MLENKWIIANFVFVVFLNFATLSLGHGQLFDVKILEDEFKDRIRRESVFEDGSAEFICADTESEICDFDENSKTCNCTCKESFYPVGQNQVGCVRGKIFGGAVTFSNEMVMDTDAKASLTKIFNDDKYFVNVSNVYNDAQDESRNKRDAEGTVIEYTLVYQNVIEVDNDYVENIFLDEYVNDMDCETVTDRTVGSLLLNVKESCGTVVSRDGDVVCRRSFNDYCDNSKSDCSVTTTGYVECICKDNFYQYNSTVCQEQICTEDSNCNSPFGWCNEDAEMHKCTCMWGFDGTNCYEPWLFTLTVVAAGCVLVILCLTIAVICCSRKNKKMKKTTTTRKKSYDDEDPTPPFNPSNYQPGLMRARVPNSSYSQIRNNSDMRLGSTGLKNGHSNNAYENSPYQTSTTTFNAPKKMPRSRDPSEYF